MEGGGGSKNPLLINFPYDVMHKIDMKGGGAKIFFLEIICNFVLIDVTIKWLVTEERSIEEGSQPGPSQDTKGLMFFNLINPFLP